MRSLLSIVLILQLLHLPVPYPDLDGECRGVPIQSLADGNAWHIVLLGVRPNDDVDRGPIRPLDENSTADPLHSPFGDPAMIAAVHQNHLQIATNVDCVKTGSFPEPTLEDRRTTRWIAGISTCRFSFGMTLRNCVLRV